MDAKKIEEVPFEEVYEVEKYGTYYSENKFWQKVQRVAKKVGATVIRPVFQLNPAKRKAMVAKNEKRFLKQKRNVLQKSESLSFRSDYPVKIQASFKRLLKAV